MALKTVKQISLSNASFSYKKRNVWHSNNRIVILNLQNIIRILKKKLKRYLITIIFYSIHYYYIGKATTTKNLHKAEPTI